MVKSACGIEAVYMCFNGTGIWGGETIKSHVKEVLHMFLSLFVKNCIFASLTLKLSF